MLQGCRKGKRECVYPELSTSSSKGRSSSKGKGSSQEGSASSEEDYDPEQEKLDTILDDEEEDGLNTAVSSATMPSSASAWSKDDKRKFSDASSASRDISPVVKSPASDTAGVPARPTSRPQLPRQPSRKNFKMKTANSAKWSHLSKDVRFFLNFHRQHLTHHHYSMKYDTGDFLKTTFLEIAMGYEPLLYAIAAFSAYHHTLTMPNGKIKIFLGYYNKSVSLLRHSLEKNPRHTLATLLTILQLATLEVRLQL